MRVKGEIDLAVLSQFDRNLAASGAAQVDVSIRGPISKPEFGGKLAFDNGTFSFIDLPNGLSKASGSIRFDQNRVTIEKLTADTGGGKVTMAGFVGFGGELVYRLQAKANQVRIRYPEGVSTALNADLNLVGTEKRSLLSGAISVARINFNPRTDFGSLLAKSAQPVSTGPARTGLLGGMQFDVRIDTAADAVIESALARDIQADANLRLRGTISNPVLLGRVSITQGEISFFGTKYQIDQGTISFLNPVKLEPVVNLDVQTRVRGVDVILTFTGPINKLSVSHRSDPPLEFSDVIALLATGRDPNTSPTVAARQSAQQQSWQQIGGAALVGQAITSPVTGRLQRFFGVSKVKIDPQLSGIENNPQARLTVEQQVTKDLTFTYITNLSRTNQQTVRIEWVLNKRWSVHAVRDDNGLFGLDFFYRKRFR